MGNTKGDGGLHLFKDARGSLVESSECFFGIERGVNATQVLDVIGFLEEEEEDDDEAEGEVVSIPRAPRSHFPRDREGKARQLFNDYFFDTPTFPLDRFRRRFRMSKSLFIRICRGVINFNLEPIPDYINYFKQIRDATGLFGFNVFQKCTSAIRQLAYGVAPDAFDEYLHTENFCKSVLHLYSVKYMKRPNAHDVQRLISKHEEIHGFPGMLGSIDCIHWGWKNCPVSWKGQFTRGDHVYPTIMLEAVASYDTWIRHSFFGPAGSNNDINVLNQLDLFNELLKDMSPPCNYTVNRLHFSRGYNLADEIYSEWSTLVKSFKNTNDPKAKKFKRFQESARKDIERAFDILQDNGRAFCGLEEDYPPTRRSRHLEFHERVALHMRMDKELRNKGSHHFLRDNLIEHIWNLPPNNRIRYHPSSGLSNIPEHVTDPQLDVEDEDDEVEEEYEDEDED
ncbi:uncharacterized protein [Rutidosis leptorrhynchoides]|uniref:uncharacterized protein n=1 Tax=Rutidosis leptorrhynchoides TaxID=125765 RepID=UPI003A998909